MMRFTLRCILLFFALAVTICTYSQRNCTIEIPPNQYDITGDIIQPGDVVCILAGSKDYLRIKDVVGTAADPVTIINKGGIVEINTDHFYGVKFDNCKHVIFRGDGESEVDYGFVVSRVANGAGMSIDNKSTNIEVSHIEISYTAIAGIYAKTEPYQGDCDNLVTRENFTMYDLSIHDCYLHDIADEGFYVGSSKYTGQTVYQCNEIVVLPHVIEGVEIFNNIIEHTGWDGIQVSSATKDCSIWGNSVSDDSYAEELFQMSGILIGGGSKCDCYNNTIKDGKGDGIDIFGMGDMMIYNNLIVNAGRTYKPNNPNDTKSGIYIGLVSGAITPNSDYKIYNNTIVSPKSYGVTLNNNEIQNAYITNNLITEPGFAQQFVNIISGSGIEPFNYLSENNSKPKFVNAQSGNYDLKPDSPAINIGTSLAAQGVTFDILYRPRPFHTYFDAGAYECHDPTAGINEAGFRLIRVFPNPAGSRLILDLMDEVKEEVSITLSSINGIVIRKWSINPKNFKDGKVKLDISNVEAGSYLLNVEWADFNYTEKLIIQQVF